jgi:SnoaL-like domain
MSEIAIEMAASEQVVLPVLTRLNHGNINDAITCFADEFTFKDRGIGLEFKNKGRLAEFFQKTREYFPDSSLQADSILVSFDRVVSEWTLHINVTEPFYGALSRRGSNLAARSVRRTDQRRGNYRMVRLLRWTDLTPHGSSCAFYRLGRALSDNSTSLRVPRPGHLWAPCNAMRRLRSGCGRCVVRIIDIDIMHWIYLRKKPILNS